MADTETDGATVTMDRLAKAYIKIRDKLSELTHAFEQQEAALKEQQAQIAGAMKDQMQAMGVKSAATTFGTVSLKTKTRFYASDWDAMSRFIIEHDAVFLLEKRIAQTNMSDYLEQNPTEPPPGLSTMSELTVAVTRPRK